MSTIRVNKRVNYFTTSNEPFNDERLSWEASGVMGYLLSKPDGWKVRMQDLESKRPTCGNYKMRRILSELRGCGYVNRIRVVDAKGKFDWVTDVYESPSLNPNPNSKIMKKAYKQGVVVTTAKTTQAKKVVRQPAPVKPTPVPSMTSQVMKAFAEHFKLTLSWGHPFDKPFLEWAINEVHMTPAMIKYASEWWSEPEQEWCKNGPSTALIRRDWLKSIAGFGEVSQDYSQAPDMSGL